MNQKLAIITIFTIITTVLGTIFWQRFGQRLNQRVEAVGDLNIIYNGLPLGAPVFDVHNMMPGDCQIRTIEVNNGGTSASQVAVQTRQVTDTDNLASVLAIRIDNSTQDIYGGASPTGVRTVADFYAITTDPDSLDLGIVAPNTQTLYTFEVCFNPDSGNQYQATQTQFDLVFGTLPTVIALPAECKHLEGIVTDVIYGTENNDNIRGTGKSELIYAVGGNNRIRGGGGHDCIVGGQGNDRIDGGTGNDVIIAGGGNNKLEGGSDDDIIYGGPGNDTLRGGSGNDTIYGGVGDSHIFGGSGDDYLDGQGGHNVIHGGPGTDTCLNGAVMTQCELP